MPPVLRSASRAPPRPAPAPAKRAKAATSASAQRSGFRASVELRPSTIAGHGVFAVRPIKRGTLIWEYVIGQSVLEHDEASLRGRLRSMTPSAVSDLLEHVYVWDGAAIEILDDAKVWNHAPAPNTGNHPDEDRGEGDGVSSYALRDIAANEELTDDYALHDHLPWFEALCRKHGATSCTQLGRTHRSET